MDLYKDFFAPGTRGYHFIRTFHHKNLNRFRNSDLEDPDALIHQVFVGVNRIRPDAIDGPVENYVIRSISYQCWRILEKEVHRLKFLNSETSNPSGDDALIDSFVQEQSSADDHLAEADLMAQIIFFRRTLKRKEQRILNCLIDEDRPVEIAKKLKLAENNVCVLIHRIRRKLLAFLKKTGYSKNSLKGSGTPLHYKNKRTL